MEITFTIPGKPIPQERPLVLRRGWTIDRPRSKKAKQLIALVASARRRTLKFAILEGYCGLEVVFYGLRKSADLSNAQKLVEDALNGVIWVDDKQLVETHVYRRTGGEDRTEVRVWAISSIA